MKTQPAGTYANTYVPSSETGNIGWGSTWTCFALYLLSNMLWDPATHIDSVGFCGFSMVFPWPCRLTGGYIMLYIHLMWFTVRGPLKSAGLRIQWLQEHRKRKLMLTVAPSIDWCETLQQTWQWNTNNYNLGACKLHGNQYFEGGIFPCHILFPRKCGHTEGFLRKVLRPGVQSRWYRKRLEFSL